MLVALARSEGGNHLQASIVVELKMKGVAVLTTAVPATIYLNDSGVCSVASPRRRHPNPVCDGEFRSFVTNPWKLIGLVSGPNHVITELMALFLQKEALTAIAATLIPKRNPFFSRRSTTTLVKCA